MFASLTCLMILGQPAPEPVNSTVIAKLVAALDDSDLDVRQNLAATLARIGQPSIAPLTAALTDPTSERRAGAAYALALHGEAASAATPNLLAMLNDKNVDVRRQASYALSHIVPLAPKGNN